MSWTSLISSDNMNPCHRLLVAAGVVAGMSLSLDAVAQTCDPPRILFVIDSSSSMRDDITEGGVTVTKWQAAQDAVHAVLAAFGDAAQYGLMTFPGSTGGCTTGSIDVDVGVGTGPEIETTLAGLNMQLSRSTPAGQSLLAASTYAGITDPAFPNYVIFLSDGWQYCSIPTSSAPVCVSSADCSLMGVDPCPTCNSCQTVSSDPACSGQPAHGCFCVRTWPVLGVEALTAANVTTFVVGFGSQVDALTLNAAAAAGGTALAGCDATSPDPSCYYQATAPSGLNAALEDIVQQVVVDDCLGPCDIPGHRTCAAAGWSACDAPSTVSCTSSCGTTGVQECVDGSLTECDAVCPDAGTGDAGGAAGAGGSAASGGTGGEAAAGGTGGAAAAGGSGGSAATGGTGGGTFDAGTDSGTAAAPGAGDTGESGDDGGCACRTGRSTGSGSLLASLAVACLALLRRRRVRPSVQSLFG